MVAGPFRRSTNKPHAKAAERTLERSPPTRRAEEVGLGIRRMREGMDGLGLPEPEFREDGFSFVITFRSIAPRETGYARSGGLAGEGAARGGGRPQMEDSLLGAEVGRSTIGPSSARWWPVPHAVPRDAAHTPSGTVTRWECVQLASRLPRARRGAVRMAQAPRS